MSRSAITRIWVGAALVAVLAGSSCARAVGPGTEGSGGGSGRAPGQSAPGSPGGGASGSGGGSAQPCGTPTVSGNGPNAAVAYTPCPGEQPTKTYPEVVQPRPGMADLSPVAFQRARVGDDDRTVTIDFWSGVAPCSVLDHVDVRYGDDTITITLFEGHDPSAGAEVACPAIAVEERVIVTLDQPLGGRTIVDGAKG